MRKWVLNVEEVAREEGLNRASKTFLVPENFKHIFSSPWTWNAEALS